MTRHSQPSTLVSERLTYSSYRSVLKAAGQTSDQATRYWSIGERTANERPSLQGTLFGRVGLAPSR